MEHPVTVEARKAFDICMKEKPIDRNLPLFQIYNSSQQMVCGS